MIVWAPPDIRLGLFGQVGSPEGFVRRQEFAAPGQRNIEVFS